MVDCTCSVHSQFDFPCRLTTIKCNGASNRIISKSNHACIQKHVNQSRQLFATAVLNLDGSSARTTWWRHRRRCARPRLGLLLRILLSRRDPLPPPSIQGTRDLDFTACQDLLDRQDFTLVQSLSRQDFAAGPLSIQGIAYRN